MSLIEQAKVELKRINFGDEEPARHRAAKHAWLPAAIIATLICTTAARAWPWSEPAAPPPAASPPASDAAPQAITGADENQTFEPEWRRAYAAHIAPGIDARLEAHSTLFGERTFGGVLKQDHRAGIYFDPNNIADKVLRPDLVPLIADFCRRAISADREWMAKPHDTIKDYQGRGWRLVPSS